MSPKTMIGLGANGSDGSIQYLERTGGTTNGSLNAKKKEAYRNKEVTRIPKNLIRIVRSKSPPGADLSDGPSPPQET